jgi:hypothetical protein
MKLYTEEQVKDFLKKRTFLTEDTIDAMCDTLTPIELPSDEEIDDKIEYSSYSLEYGAGFKFGIEWVINCIKQQEQWIKEILKQQ